MIPPAMLLEFVAAILQASPRRGHPSDGRTSLDRGDKIAAPTTPEETRMIKAGIDTDALVKMFSEASAKQGEALRKAVSDATLKALQGRELTLANIRTVLKTVTQATSAGAAQNPAAALDVEGMLSKALAGMDAALLQAVEANRKALEQFVGRGAGLQDGPLKEAVGNLEKMEDMFFAAVSKATQASGPLQ